MFSTPKPRKPDRRKQQTKQHLRAVLIALMLEKGYDDITVQDIADRAGVSHATFYLHYASKEELLTQSQERLYDELMAPIEPLGGLNTMTAALQVAFDHAAEHADLYRVILRGAGSATPRLHAYIAAYMKQHLIPMIQPDVRARVSLDLICNGLAGSMLAMCAWWLEAERPFPSAIVTQIYLDIHLPGLRLIFETT